MDWTIYVALVVGTLALAGGVALVSVRGLRAWRDFKRFRRQLTRELDHLAEAGERTAAAAGRAGDSAELTASLGRLRVTLDRFAVLRAALDEATSPVTRVTWIYPRK